MSITVKALAGMKPGERAAMGRSTYVRRNTGAGYTATIRVRHGGKLVERTVMAFEEPSRAVMDQIAKASETIRGEIQSAPVQEQQHQADHALKPGAALGEVYSDFSEYCARNRIWNARNVEENRKRIDRHLKPSSMWRRKIADINAIDLSDFLGPIKNATPDQCAKLVGLLNGTFTHAVAARVATTSPMPLVKSLMARVKRGRPKEHFAALTDVADLQDLARRIIDMGQASGSVRDALRLQLETAQRTGEIQFARWREFNLDDGVWVIPRARMKRSDAHRDDHTVPLSPQTVAWLKAKRARWQAGKPKANDDLVFSSPRSKVGAPPTDDSLTKAMRVTLGMRGQHVPHGARAALRTLATGAVRADGSPRFNVQWIESLLDHTPGTLSNDTLKGAYDRGKHMDGMRAVVGWWVDLLEGVQA